MKNVFLKKANNVRNSKFLLVLMFLIPTIVDVIKIKYNPDNNTNVNDDPADHDDDNNNKNKNDK